MGHCNKAMKTAEPAAARRHFVVLCHKGRWDGNFPVDDLSQGRMDLKARCIQTALFYSYGVRKDSTVTLLDADTARSLAVLGSTAETMRPDERRIGELMQGSLCSVPLPTKLESELSAAAAAAAAAPPPEQSVSEHTAQSRQRQQKHDVKKFANLQKSWASKRCGASCGFMVTDGDSLESCIQRRAPGIADKGRVVLLVVEDGKEWHEVKHLVEHAEQVVCVMGDNVGLLEQEDQTASAMGAVRVRLGCVPMLSSHCIVVLHHLLDQIAPPTAWAKLSDVRVHAIEQAKPPCPQQDALLTKRVGLRVLAAFVVTLFIVVKVKF